MSKPLISMVMGSDSDLAIMSDAAKFLDEFDIPYELTILSAHRTPKQLHEHSQALVKRGIKVVIAGAGGAAALPGAIASLTPLPVIGVPIKGKSLDGLDALLSMAQMPPGIPVATVAINGAKNASILAVQILATADKTLEKRLIAYKEKLADNVEKKAAKLSKIGWQKYIEEKK